MANEFFRVEVEMIEGLGMKLEIKKSNGIQVHEALGLLELAKSAILEKKESFDLSNMGKKGPIPPGGRES